MRTTFDFSTLFRSSIGFDRIVDALETAKRIKTFDNWPPYDIVKTGEDDYRIVMAVAGFLEDELTIIQEQNVLVVSGRKEGEDTGEVLHRGITNRAFQHRFELADHVRVEGAGLDQGLLTIDLRREMPEEMKPRHIEIVTSGVDLPKLEAKPEEPEELAA